MKKNGLRIKEVLQEMGGSAGEMRGFFAFGSE
jgi:hypothetical protein